MTRPTPASLFVWTLAVVLIAGIVHISSVFLMPTVAAQNSFVRLSGVTEAPGFRRLDLAKLSELALPFSDPGVVLMACRYDLRASPFRLRVDIDGEALTSLSFHSRRGIVFHTLTDRAALRGKLDVLLGTAAQIDAAEAADTDEVQTREVRLVSPSPDGIVLLRAMPPSAAGQESLLRRLEKAECGAAL